MFVFFYPPILPLYYEEKIRIAEKFSGLVSNPASVFLNIQAATEDVPGFLKRTKKLSQGYHQPEYMPGDKDYFEGIVAGGLIRSKDMCITG